MASPTLSSIALDCESIGYQAAALLDRLLSPAQEPSRGGGAIQAPPLRVIVRESTRIFTCGDPLIEQAVS